MNNFQTVVGIEVHTVVNSKTKMFSASTSSHTDPVNQNINEIDIGLPGTLPSVNDLVVKKAICLAHALHMNIADVITFDRKNYFYRDLPKGYQITQQFNPIGTEGYVEIEVGNKKKRIRVERIHMEEDTAKQLKVDGRILLDYNRCGMPLIEIVSKPDIASAEEAIAYLTQLKRILTFCGEISDAKMEDGSLRADVNISVNPYGAKQYGTRVEIKNINSITNVGKAIAYEANRQMSLYLQGKEVTPDTRRYDDAKGETVYMRDKQSVDYHFMPEGNILPFALSNEFKQEALRQAKYTLEDIVKYLTDLKLDSKIVTLLLDDYPLYKAFRKVIYETNDPQAAVTWILVELVGLLKKDNKNIESVSNKKLQYIIDMIKILAKGNINSKQAKTVIAEIYKDEIDPETIIKKHGFKQIVDANELEKLLRVIVDKNIAMVEKNKDRPERVEKMLLGQLMKETQGQANPVIATNVLRMILNKK